MTGRGSLVAALRESAERLSSVCSLRQFTPEEAEEAVNTLLTIPRMLAAIAELVGAAELLSRPGIESGLIQEHIAGVRMIVVADGEEDAAVALVVRALEAPLSDG